jgi:transposase
MCSVLEFSSESDKLRTLFSESNRFDSVLFIFDGGRRYKVSSSSLGIHSPQDLLLPLGLGLFRSSPFWSYYLYPQGCNFHKGIDGLCGEVIRHTGSCVSEQSCHIFPDRSRSRLHILYRCDDEYTVKKDCYNSLDFKPVKTKGLKIAAQLQKGASGGVIEWKVN